MDERARRREFASALADSPALEVVGATPADVNALRAVAGRQPDLVVLESALPGVDGAKFVGRLRAVAPRAGVIALAAPGDRPRSIVARRLAADRYADPEITPEGLSRLLAEWARERRERRTAS
jgi:DNA-binding NarL/FixJ family response regulator